MTPTDGLISKLPKGPPHHRLEFFLAMLAVLDHVRRAGRPIIVRPSDAPQIVWAARVRGLTLPLATVQAAITRLMRPDSVSR